MANLLWRNKKLRYFFLSCIIVLAGAGVATLVAVILYGFGVLQSDATILLLCVAVAVAAVGAVLTMIISRVIIQPVTRLSEASQQIARGNFDLNLTYDGAVEEFRDTYHSFNMMAKELQTIETLRTDFTANVSHEFKTPLTAIEGYAVLLQDPALPLEEQAECVQKILDSASRLSDLVSNILLLTKLEQQTSQAGTAPYRLDEQLRQVMVELEPLWAEKQLDLKLCLPELRYNGSEGLLYHVWSNLLRNGIKFSPKGGLLSVQLTEKAQEIYFQVTDQGPGMSPDVQRHIFDKFYQGDPSRKQEGNGLGLSLAQRIVQLCGGQITVQSQLGQGSAFTVILPKQNASLPPDDSSCLAAP